MASLSGQNPSATFPSLIKTINNNPVTNLVQLSDGNGNSLPISVSRTNVSISSPVTASIVWANSNSVGTNFKIGDDLWIGDVDIANTAQLMGVEDATQGFIKFGSGSNSAIIGGVAGAKIFQVTASLNVQSGITGSLFGTASVALSARSASYASTASYVLNAVSSSYALTASYALSTSVNSGVVNESDVTPWTYYVIPTANVNTGSEVVTTTTNILTTGQLVYYTAEGGASIGGLTDGGNYYARVASPTTFTLYDTAAHALATGSTTGLKNLTSTGNNNQRITVGGTKTVTYDTSNGTLVFVQNQAFGDVSASFTNVNLNNNQATTLNVYVTNNSADDFNLASVSVNSTPVTVVAIGPDLKLHKNRTDIVNATLVKSGGIYTAYVNVLN